MAAVKGSEPVKLSRRGRAKATQWRIVKAAYDLFCAQGYAATTMAQIAEAARVAVQTVYFAFHTNEMRAGVPPSCTSLRCCWPSYETSIR